MASFVPLSSLKQMKIANTCPRGPLKKKKKKKTEQNKRIFGKGKTHLEIAIVHTPKHFMLPQPLRRNPRTRHPKRDPSQESRVVPDVRGSQYGLDLLLVDPSFPRKVVVTRLEEVDRGL